MSRYRSSSYSSSGGLFSYCLVQFIFLAVVLAIGFVIGEVAVNYIAQTVFHHTLLFWQAGVIGLLTGDTVIVVAVIVWFLQLVGVF